MARPKLPRKSTTVDMTAMCDVAFLLLSFFILTTKFKPSENVTVAIPSSVSSKPAPEKDVVMVSITKDGKVFLTMDDEENKETLLNTVNTVNNLGLTPAEISRLVKAPVFGVPLEQLKQQSTLTPDKLTDQFLPGIPVLDSTNNQMLHWMRGIVSTYQGKKLNLLMKGDNATRYPAFKSVITAFKKNDVFKFQMVTNPENVPEGSELWRKHMKGEDKEG